MQSQEDFQRNTRVLQETLVHAFVLGAVGLYASDPAFTFDVSSRPVVCPLVRHQAVSSEKVTSRLHSTISLDPIARWMVTQLDGSIDTGQLFELLVEHVQNEKMAVQVEGRLLTSPEEIRQHLQTKLMPNLQQLAFQGLLIAEASRPRHEYPSAEGTNSEVPEACIPECRRHDMRPFGDAFSVR